MYARRSCWNHPFRTTLNMQLAHRYRDLRSTSLHVMAFIPVVLTLMRCTHCRMVLTRERAIRSSWLATELDRVVACCRRVVIFTSSC